MMVSCAHSQKSPSKALPLAETLLAPSAADAATLDRQLETLRELQHLKLDVEAATRCRLAQHLLAAQRLADAESTLDGLAGHDDARLPSLWLALGRNWLEQQRYSKARAQLSHVVERAPRSAEANKARFLLAEMPPDRSTT